jgi:glycerol-3-phosphate dehydrogenase subunit C
MEACADCDICRYLMEDTPCLVFPELYRLYDKEAAKSGSITPDELRGLVELCNFCGLCPCPNIRADIMKAKHAFIQREGLRPTIRVLEDVERVARTCGAYPRLANLLFQSKWTGPLLKGLAGIHADRKVPIFPEESFPSWARSRGLHVLKEGGHRKVAFFAGCTGQYLFPAVPRAAVEVLEFNSIPIYVPEQKCCGMPSLLEGDRRLTLEFAAFNMEKLSEAVDAGCDIVCSCPTCGYLLKQVLSEGASHAVEHRETPGPSSCGSQDEGKASKPEGAPSASSSKHAFKGLFKDEGYFASLDPRKRLKIASRTYDLGEYLLSLQRSGELSTRLGPVSGRMVYYPPCHLREQKIGTPYMELLTLIPGISIELVEGVFHCCGIAGIMGFKQEFHEVSIAMGSRLMERIKAMGPQRLVTDCLSCRIQFNQLLPYEVLHPVEVFGKACRSFSPAPPGHLEQ